MEFKSKRSAWAEGIEPLPRVPASVERVATTSLLALCIQGIFSVVKLLPHFYKRNQPRLMDLTKVWGQYLRGRIGEPITKTLVPDLQISHSTQIRGLVSQKQTRKTSVTWKGVSARVENGCHWHSGPLNPLLTRSYPRKSFSGNNNCRERDLQKSHSSDQTARSPFQPQ